MNSNVSTAIDSRRPPSTPVDISRDQPRSVEVPCARSPLAGMTMIELGIVMGIVSVLLALVLGLARHVNTTVKIRRAQADLAEWHETFNRWHLQFGEYPHARIDTNLDHVESLDSVDWTLQDPSRFPLAILTNQCEVIFQNSTVTLSSFMTADISTVDPWGTPYIYLCDPGRQAYTLFSCGPDAQTQLAGGNELNNLDDIFFER